MKSRIHSLAHFIASDSRDYGVLGTDSFVSVKQLLVLFYFLYKFVNLSTMKFANCENTEDELEKSNSVRCILSMQS